MINVEEYWKMIEEESKRHRFWNKEIIKEYNVCDILNLLVKKLSKDEIEEFVIELKKLKA